MSVDSHEIRQVPLGSQSSLQTALQPPGPSGAEPHTNGSPVVLSPELESPLVSPELLPCEPLLRVVPTSLVLLVLVSVAGAGGSPLELDSPSDPRPYTLRVQPKSNGTTIATLRTPRA